MKVRILGIDKKKALLSKPINVNCDGSNGNCTFSKRRTEMIKKPKKKPDPKNFILPCKDKKFCCLPVEEIASKAWNQACDAWEKWIKARLLTEKELTKIIEKYMLANTICGCIYDDKRLLGLTQTIVKAQAKKMEGK